MKTITEQKAEKPIIPFIEVYNTINITTVLLYLIVKNILKKYDSKSILKTSIDKALKLQDYCSRIQEILQCDRVIVSEFQENILVSGKTDISLHISCEVTKSGLTKISTKYAKIPISLIPEQAKVILNSLNKFTIISRDNVHNDRCKAHLLSINALYIATITLTNQSNVPLGIISCQFSSGEKPPIEWFKSQRITELVDEIKFCLLGLSNQQE